MKKHQSPSLLTRDRYSNNFLDQLDTLHAQNRVGQEIYVTYNSLPIRLMQATDPDEYALVGNKFDGEPRGAGAVDLQGLRSAYDRVARGAYSVISGGGENGAWGLYSTVPGGLGCYAKQNYSFAAGRRAIANAVGATVFSDSTDADYEITTANVFAVRAAGGFWLNAIANFRATMGNSTKNPATDAPADWVEVQINGTTYYIPAYAA